LRDNFKIEILRTQSFGFLASSFTKERLQMGSKYISKSQDLLDYFKRFVIALVSTKHRFKAIKMNELQ